jgi:hypothetical protein
MIYVSKLTWEYGEEYGHVYYPETLVDLQGKIAALNDWGKEKEYSFMIAALLTDGSYLGFTVGHQYSLVEFTYICDGNLEGPFYLSNPDGHTDEIIPVYIGASHTEPDTTRMYPLQQVLEAIYHYVEHRTFPSFIQFDSERVNKQFVISADLDSSFDKLK